MTRFGTVALACMACALSGATAAELRLVDGKVLSGTAVRMDAQGIAWKDASGGESRHPLDQVARIDPAPAPARNPSEAWSDVELTDGSILRATRIVFAKDSAKAELSGGGEITFPLGSIQNILFPAHRDDWRKDWTTRLAQKRRKDILAILRQDAVNA
ncbi:MAG: hypothetical protein ACKO26_20840, partial [Planctomycetota bacterium]